MTKEIFFYIYKYIYIRKRFADLVPVVVKPVVLARVTVMQAFRLQY